MTEQQTSALNYLAQAISDYAATLPPSIRGPFVRECEAAIKILRDSVEAQKA